jgi:hypothetical protein
VFAAGRFTRTKKNRSITSGFFSASVMPINLYENGG